MLRLRITKIEAANTPASKTTPPVTAPTIIPKWLFPELLEFPEVEEPVEPAVVPEVEDPELLVDNVKENLEEQPEAICRAMRVRGLSKYALVKLHV